MNVSLILIVPLGKISTEVLEYLQENLKDRFGIAVQIGQPLADPEYALYEKRNQYYSTKILDQVVKSKKEDEKILGVVDADLFVPNLNFVFGEADIENGVCLISLSRLRQEFYGQEPDEMLFLERVLKEGVHELGHTYGLGHCADPRCVMYFSNSLADTDYKRSSFCTRCRDKIK
jgi:archaemetzincin